VPLPDGIFRATGQTRTDSKLCDLSHQWQAFVYNTLARKRVVIFLLFLLDQRRVLGVGKGDKTVYFAFPLSRIG